MPARVLLTGSTGNLGTYLLSQLDRLGDQVENIYCLNRGANAEQRQQEQLEARGLPSIFPSSPVVPRKPKILYFTSDLSRSDLGLPAATYEYLLSSTTHILHNAWPVDWNKSFSSFKGPIHGVKHLIDFAHSAPHKPLLFFVSSQAVVGNWGAVPGARTRVPEHEIDDWKVARFGYGQSKLVAECLLAEAARAGKITAAICRVGQISGPVKHEDNGSWPLQEWVPSLIASSDHMKLLPDSLGALDHVDWIPVDILADVIVELLLSNIQPKGRMSHHHVTNPSQTQWSTLVPTILSALGPDIKAISIADWVSALEKSSELIREQVSQSPAVKLLPFFLDLKEKAIHLPKARAPTLEIKETMKRSRSLRSIVPVSPAWMSLWLRQWGYAVREVNQH